MTASKKEIVLGTNRTGRVAVSETEITAEVFMRDAAAIVAAG